MTRGKLVLYTPSKELYSSIEFNGDMYFYGCGKLAFDIMNGLETFDEFKDAVEYFNERTKNYKEKLIYKCSPAIKYLTGFKKKDYYDYWFSDYIYFKNASEDNIETKDYEGKSLTIPANTVVILNFGKLYTPTKEEKEEATKSIA